MNKPYRLALHIFRRDLRLQDNAALLAALNSAETVIPCFIFDTRQIGDNHYKGNACLQFMAASLAELDAELKKKNSQLFFFDGIAEQTLDKILSLHPIDAVFINRDYTPFSRQRDAALANICKQRGFELQVHADALLHEPESCLKANHQPYTVFTHFFNRAKELPVNPPRQNKHANYFQHAMKDANQATLSSLLQINNPHLRVKGGRTEVLQLLKNVTKMRDYHDSRNFPAQDSTTHLSAHHKFGTLSIRETYAAITAAFGPHHTLINELYWRDFFTHIGFHFPRVFSGAFQQKYDALRWHSPDKVFALWCQGMTGFPIVDAGMRELNQTGLMHNRVRMITASFLTKDLHLDWRLGERYFAQQLVDYDPAVNNGNWQWSASTGCDAQPYFRIFNPWLQQKKFDPECLYIKKYIPELSHLAPKAIHALAEITPTTLLNYPNPIISHAKESQLSKQLFQSI
jgi:deoxyribodipyrimidine photo-lyase